MSTRSNRRARLATVSLAVLIVIVGSGCSVSFDDGQVSFVDEDAQLLCDEGSSVTLAAQSVPTADHVPCVAELPSGWSIDYTDFEHDGVEIGLDSRRAPIDDMVIHFNETCEAGQLTVDMTESTLEVPDDAIATQDVDGLAFRLVIVGGGYCAELIAALDADEPVTAVDFPTLSWIPRTAIDAGISAATDDRLRLDP